MGRLFFLPLFLLCSVAIACGGDDDPPPIATTRPASGAAQSQTTTEGRTGSVSSLPSSVNLEHVFVDHIFQAMTGLYEAPDGSWWLTEQEGRLTRLDSQTGEAKTVLDITDRVRSGALEQGLLGFTFASDFRTSGRFFVDYTAGPQLHTVISSFVADTRNWVVDPASEVVRLEVMQPFGNHNGGQIVLGPDGYLYIGLGDGGSAGDPQGNGQNRGTLLGSLLRIDVSGEQGYAVPADNPFVGQPGARGEVWAYGLRNPWRFSFDTETGEFWVGDVGQNENEEVNLVKKGGNYGWNIMEGFECYESAACEKSGLSLPVSQYTHADGCAITGGFVYHGSAIPSLAGAYVYGDYCSGKIWALRYDGSQVTEDQLIAEPGFSISSFAQGSDGELYVLQYSNLSAIYKLVP